VATYQLEPGSFRDRTSRVFYSDGAVHRALNEQAFKEWESLSSRNFFRRFTDEQKIIGTKLSDASDYPEILLAGTCSAILRHERIPFISYPYEWSFGMLKDAALLQTELLLAALEEDMILKDSSAFNFQWTGARPVFIDIPSFMDLQPGEPWVGYRQFCQMFLYPLMLQAYKDIPFQPLIRGNIDGFEPEDFNKLMSFRDLFRAGVFLHVALHAKAQLKYAATDKDIRKGLRAGGFSKALIKRNIEGLDKVIRGISWERVRSQWSHYDKEHSYSDAEHEVKKAFVRKVVASRPWELVWDLGCNVGTFSRIASENARTVVSCDTDHLAIEYFYQELKKEGNTKILPLVCNVANPSPNLGWRGLERKTMQERGTPDLTLCLALIHHLVISANIPLREFITWLAQLKTALIIEFVTKQDPMVQKLLLNKNDNYNDYEIGYFEKCLSEFFTIIKQETVKEGKRILYYAEVKNNR
jgi:hypothetical protein